MARSRPARAALREIKSDEARGVSRPCTTGWALGMCPAAPCSDQSGGTEEDVDGATGLPEVPDAATQQAFVGRWSLVGSENYAAFLEEAVGMSSSILRKIAERIHPTPIISFNDNGTLRIETVCIGAKPVVELLEPGDYAFFEPNLRANYKVNAHWQGGTFVAERQNDSINGGRPVLQRRWVDRLTGRLVIEQDWGAGKKFTARFERAQQHKNR